MSILERLKREEQAQRLAAETARREREARERTYLEQIDPRMRRLVELLEETVRTLINLKPAVRAYMNIAGYGDLVAQPMWNYQLDHERRHRGWALKLSWTWRVDPTQSPVVRAETAAKCKALTAAFRSHQLAGIKEEARNRAGDEIVMATFHARGLIRASFQASISAEDPVLRMAFSNASWLGSSQRQVHWVHIDEALFDKLVRFLLREDDTLFTEEFDSRREIEADSAQAQGHSPQAAQAETVEPEAPAIPLAPPVELPSTAASTASEPPPAEADSMDDVLSAIPDPTAALIAALGSDDTDASGSALSMDDWSPAASAPAAAIAAQPAQEPASPPPQPPPEPEPAATGGASPPAPPASRSVAPGTTGPVDGDFEPLTRTEAALIAKLRRKVSGQAPVAAPSNPPAAAPAPAKPAGASPPPDKTDAAAQQNQRLDAAAFRRRMSGMLSKLREDGSGGNED